MEFKALALVRVQKRYVWSKAKSEDNERFDSLLLVVVVGNHT